MLQREKMIDVIKTEAALVSGLLCSNVTLCGHPGRCAMGALLFAAGVSNDTLSTMDGDCESVWMEFSHVLRKEYGFSSEKQVWRVIADNDAAIDLGMLITSDADYAYRVGEKRMYAVIETIRSLSDDPDHPMYREF